jgi:gliding motility-associated-like protein
MKAITPLSALLLIQQGLVKKLCIYLTFLTPLFWSQTLPQICSITDSVSLAQHLANYKTEANRNTFLNYINRRSKNPESKSQLTVPASPELCTNIGFEGGNTQGWSINGDYKIVSSGVDTFGNFPKVFPNGGNHSLQLNNNSTSGKSTFAAKAARIINVGPGNTGLTIHFAMVILEYPHIASNAARFKVRLKDANQQTLACPNFDCYYDANTGATGVSNFSLSTISGLNTVNMSYPVSYTPWQSVYLDLTAYSGQNLTLEIECNWCQFNVDWAYCYLDVDCNTNSPTQTVCTSFPHILNAPAGMQHYNWTSASTTNTAVSTRSFEVTSPGDYTLECIPVGACSSVSQQFHYSILSKPDANFSLAYEPCNLRVQLNGAPIHLPLQNSSAYIWQMEGNTVYRKKDTIHLFKSAGIKTINYFVTAANGCRDTATQIVKLSAPVNIAIVNASSSNYIPEQGAISLQAQSNYSFGNLNYIWSGPNFQATQAQINAFEAGEYIVIAIDRASGCSDTARIRLELASELEVPNVFTPNRDGVNDGFFMKARNLVYSEAIVYDRWGNTVYDNSKNSNTIFWDGKNKQGIDCSEGVFFYTINAKGKDGTHYNKQGTVTLLR